MRDLSFMRPIKIYLDSSDFSDLSYLEKKALEYTEVRDYLLRMQRDGLVRMYFSDTHVIEAAPTTPAAIMGATQRLRTIKEICGKNSVLHPTDVIKRELTRGPGAEIEFTRNDGFWFPEMLNLSEMIPDVEKFFRNDVEKRGRSEKRRYLKDGKPTPLWYAEMREANNGAAQVVVKHLPLSSRAVRTINRYYTGSATRAEAINAVAASIGDLEVFGAWYENDWKSAINMSNYLREIGHDFKEEISRTRSLFENLVIEGGEAGLDEKTVRSSSTEAFYDVLKQTPARIAKAMAERVGGKVDSSVDPWKAAPGLTCSITLAMHVARRSVSSAMPRAAKQSDFPDCYHAVYLPYFDVFRADSFTTSVIAECKLPFDTIVVDKFLQLPAKIDGLLAVRRQEET